MIKVETMEPLVLEQIHNDIINPYNQDFYHMGTAIGHNVEVMFEKFSTDTHNYIIVVNKKTGGKS